MTDSEPTVQALLDGLRVQGGVDGDRALHALIEADLVRDAR